MDAFQEFAQQFAIYGYPLLFAGVLLENAGIPLPGETAVVVAGFLASPAGGSHFNLLWVIVTVFVAAVLGDNLGFWLGHRYARPRLAQGRGFLFLTPKSLQLAEGYFKHYGVWTVFFARFIAGLRIVGALAAGTAGMSWPHFLAANAAGALSWATAISLLGYFFGHSWELLHHVMERGSVIILGCIVVLIGLRYLLHRFQQTPRTVLQHLARRQVWQGLLAAALEGLCLALLVLAQGGKPTHLDIEVDAFIANHGDVSILHGLASVLSFLGSLPAVMLIAGMTVIYLYSLRRPWRQAVAVLAALILSEGLGLALSQVLRSRDVQPIPAAIWPFGFAGSIPLRAAAVFGMIPHVLGRAWGWRPVLAAGLAPALLTALGVLWLGEQTLTEIVLEFIAGALVLFACIWWLEGYGLGLVPATNPQVDQPPHDSTKESIQLER
jgi:membrane protein DedA with SNARE-associated domain